MATLLQLRPFHRPFCSNIFKHTLSIDRRPRCFRSFSTRWSKRQIADLESQIYTAVTTNVQDPILQRPLGELDWLQRRISITENENKETSLHMLLRLPSLLHPELAELTARVQRQATATAQQFLTTTPIDVQVQAIASTTPIPFMARLVEDHEHVLQKLGPGLQSVAHVIAVYSAKGGVGKSTVAVNLAYTLAQQGGRVGLLDVDVYGPSLPLLVRPQDTTVRRSHSHLVHPLEHEGVKLLSMGFVNRQSGVPGSGPDNGAAIMKGPMVVKVVTQLLKGTDWGALDVLVLDLPPGTGDVQLAVLQHLQLSGAVAVTTPSVLAQKDTQRGIDMFTSLGVPTLAVVENMAYYVDAATQNKKVRVFGTASSLSEKENTIELPLSSMLNACNEKGIPLMLDAESSTAVVETEAFAALGRTVSRELLCLQYGAAQHQHTVSFADGSSAAVFELSTLVLTLPKVPPVFSVRFVGKSAAMAKSIPPAMLRSVDPKTGDVLADSPFLVYVEQQQTTKEPIVVTSSSSRTTTSKRPPSILPVTVERRGRYGFAVEWGDGATIIYSLLAIAKAAGGTIASVE